MDNIKIAVPLGLIVVPVVDSSSGPHNGGHLFEQVPVVPVYDRMSLFF